MRATIKEDWKPVLFQAVATALAIILLLIGATFLLGNKQQTTLEDLRDATRAEVCVLALPVGPHGRNNAAVHECLRRYGL